MAKYGNYLAHKLNKYIYNLHTFDDYCLTSKYTILHNSKYLCERVKFYKYIIIIAQLIKINFPIRSIIVIVLSN